MNLLRHGAKLTNVGSLAAWEIGQQIVTIAIGFVLVRYATKDSYAVYAFFTIILAQGLQLANLGLNHCYLPLIGSRFADRTWVQGCTRQLFFLRKRLSWIAIPFTAVYAIVILIQKGWMSADAAISLILTLFLLSAEIFGQVISMMFIAARESQVLQRISFLTQSIRLPLLALAVFLAPSLVWPLLLLSLATAVARNRIFARTGIGVGWNNTPAEPNGELEKELASARKRMEKIQQPLLTSGILAFARDLGSLSIIALFVDTSVFAEQAALGRLMLILTFVDRMHGFVTMPFLSARKSPSEFLRGFILIGGVQTVLLATIFISSLVAPHAWLLLLGSQYSDLSGVLYLFVGAGLLNNFSGFILTAAATRGITGHQYIVIILPFVAQLAFAALHGISSAADIGYFSLVAASLSLITRLILFVVGYTTHRASHA